MVVNYSPRYATKPDYASWPEVALFMAKGALLVIGLYVIRGAVYEAAPIDLAPFATAAAYCVVAWAWVIARSWRDGEAMRIAAAALWSAFVAIAILYLLFG